MNPDEKLKREVDREAGRIKQAEEDRRTLIAQTIYLGTLGLLFIVPVIIGAYVGRWLDGLSPGYSVRWTLSMIILGIVVGAVNVYLLIRE